MKVIHNLLLLLLIVILNDGGVTNAQTPTLTAIGTLRGYTSGGSHIKFTATNFVNVPIVKMTYGGMDVSLVIYQAPPGYNGEYTFSVPTSPFNSIPKSVPMPTLFTITATETGSPNKVVSVPVNQFNYVVPRFDLSPEIPRTLIYGGEYTFRGTNLFLNAWETIPLIIFGDIDATGISHDDNQIRVVVPPSRVAGDVQVTAVLTLFTIVVVMEKFTYVEPYVNSIYPRKGYADQPTLITLTGSDFGLSYIVNNLGGTMSVKYDGVDCTGLVYNPAPLGSETITCTIPPAAVPATKTKQIELLVTIGATVYSVPAVHIQFKQIMPVISNKLPILLGARHELKFKGTDLDEITEVLINGLSCKITSNADVINELACIAPAPFLDPLQEQQTFPIQFKINSQVANLDQTITYYKKPIITSLITTTINSQISNAIIINGKYLNRISQYKIRSIVNPAIEILGPIGSLVGPTFTQIKIDVGIGSPISTLGTYKLLLGEDVPDPTTPTVINTVFSDPSTETLTVVEPKISISPATGYLYESDRVVTITPLDFPPGVTVDNFIVKFNGIQVLLTSLPDGTFTCLVPVGAATGATPVTFELFKTPIISTTPVVYTYTLPSIGGLSKDRASISDPGDLTLLTGLSLDKVSYVTIGTTIVNVPFSPSPTTLTFSLPTGLRPGPYSILFGNAYMSFPTAMVINYFGPVVTSINPTRADHIQDIDVTITGSYLIDPSNMVPSTIMIGDDICIPKAGTISTSTQIICTRKATSVPMKTLRVVAQYSLTVKSIDMVMFKSYGLSCHGFVDPNLPNNHANLNNYDLEPKDWWFIQKLVESSVPPLSGRYLYSDSNVDNVLTLKDNFDSASWGGAAVPISPLGETFDQYTDPNTNSIFVNEQQGARIADGGKGRGVDEASFGHMKQIVMWRYDQLTGNTSGIHILHSNPVFPGSPNLKPAPGNTNPFYQFSDGRRFAGSPIFAQHFYCYTFSGKVRKEDGTLLMPLRDHLDLILESFVRNDAVIVNANTVKMFVAYNPGDIIKNRYSYLYDFLQENYDASYRVLPIRVPGAGDPPVINRETIRDECQAEIESFSPSLIDLTKCIGKFDTIQLDNGFTAQFFHKAYINTARNIDVSRLLNPAASLPYVIYKGNVATGLGIWEYIAHTYQKKYFMEGYHKSNKLIPPNELVYNTRSLNLPIHLRGQDDEIRYSRDHSKLGIPMYPETSYALAYTGTNNMFCIGDLNRHYGQERRGGGAMCIRHPKLSLFYNRMVAGYMGKLPFPQRPYAGKYFPTIYGNQVSSTVAFIVDPNWYHPIHIEMKEGQDFAYTKHASFVPPVQFTMDYSVLMRPAISNSFHHVAIRNTFDDTYSKMNPLDIRFREIPIVPPPGGPLTGPPPLQPEITTWLMDEYLTAWYSLAIDRVVYICEYFDGLDCNSLFNAAQVQLPNNDVQNSQTAYNQAQHFVMPLRTFRFDDQLSPKIIDFIARFSKFFIDSTGWDVLPVQILIKVDAIRPYPMYYQIIRTIHDLNEEELAYLITCSFVTKLMGTVSNPIFVQGGISYNWANALLLSISKLALNEMKGLTSVDLGQHTLENSFLDRMFTGFAVPPRQLSDLNNPILSGSLDSMEEFVRSSACAFQILNPGPGKLMWIDQLKYLVTLRVGSVNNLYDFFARGLELMTPLYDIFVNNRLKPPKVTTMVLPPAASSSSTSMVSFLKLFKVVKEVAGDYELEPSGIDQLFNYQPQLFTDRILLDMDQDLLDRLSVSIDRWIELDSKNQAVQQLVVLPRQVTSPALNFIDSVNRDILGNEIELCFSNSVNNTAILCHPKSIISITNYLASLVISSSSSNQKVFGPVTLYYYKRPYLFSSSINTGSSKTFYDGMVIATLNNLFCEVKLINTTLWNNNNLLISSLCLGAGPIIDTITSPLNGPTQGGNLITIRGFRLVVPTTQQQQSTNNICSSYNLVNSTMLVCTVKSGVNNNNPIQFYSLVYSQPQIIYNYDLPTITKVTNNINQSPPSINTDGNQPITIQGINFGSLPTTAEILIDKEFECRILSISHTQIICYPPPGVGSFKHILVQVGNQQSQYTIDTMNINMFNYRPVQITAAEYDYGSGYDRVAVYGSGFGGSGSSPFPPILYVNNHQVNIYNYSDNSIIFSMPPMTETISPTFSILQGDQLIANGSLWNYLQPYITSISRTSFPISGGPLIIYGFGFSTVKSDITLAKVGTYNLDCEPFDTFLECTVPPGTGANLPISIIIADTPLASRKIYNISFTAAPTISSVVVNPNNKDIYFYGTNLPLAGYLDSTSYVNVLSPVPQFPGPNYVQPPPFRCPTLEWNATMVHCTLNQSYEMGAIQLIIANQVIKHQNFSGIYGDLFKDTNMDNYYNYTESAINLPGVSITVTLKSESTLTVYSFAYTSPTIGYQFFNLLPGNYRIDVSMPARTPPLLTTIVNKQIVIPNPTTTYYQDIAYRIAFLEITNYADPYTCISNITSTLGERMNLIAGTYSLTAFGWCGVSASCSNKLSTGIVGDGCAGSSTVNTFTIIKWMGDVTFRVRKDPYLNCMFDGNVPPPSSSYYTSIQYYHNGQLVTKTLGGTTSGDYLFKYVDYGTITLNIHSPTLRPMMNNTSFQFDPSNPIDVTFGIYDVSATLPFAMTTFYSLPNNAGSQLIVPADIGIMREFLTRCGWDGSKRRIQSFTAPTNYNVYLYRDTASTSQISVPLNGVVNNVADTVLSVTMFVPSLFNPISSTQISRYSGQSFTLTTPYFVMRPKFFMIGTVPSDLEITCTYSANVATCFVPTYSTFTFIYDFNVKVVFNGVNLPSNQQYVVHYMF